jgi:hypothetical protein
MAVTFDSIGTQTITGSSTSTINFTSISSAYTDLFLVVKAKTTSGDQDARIRFNNDTSASYATGSICVNTSGGKTGSFLIGLTSGYITNWGYDSPSSFGCHEVYILNYGSSKHKSWNCESGSQNGADLIQGIWQNTAAISSITLFNNSTQWTVGTSAELYGIKAA